MNKSTFDDLLTHIQSLERQVRDDGQREYAQDIDNVFANFDRVATHLNLTREQVLLVYALKHWDGIIAYVKGYKSQREDIRGRIKDLRMYLALLWGMVDDSDTLLDDDFIVHDCNLCPGGVVNPVCPTHNPLARVFTTEIPCKDSVTRDESGNRTESEAQPLSGSIDWKEVNEGMEELIANGLPPKGPDNLTFGLGDILPRPPKVSTNDDDVHLKREEPHHYTCDCCECNRY